MDSYISCHNSVGLCALCPNSNNSLLAYPAKGTGQVGLVDLVNMESAPQGISAHETGITCLALNLQGTRLATSSEKVSKTQFTVCTSKCSSSSHTLTLISSPTLLTPSPHTHHLPYTPHTPHTSLPYIPLTHHHLLFTETIPTYVCMNMSYPGYPNSNIRHGYL